MCDYKRHSLARHCINNRFYHPNNAIPHSQNEKQQLELKVKICQLEEEYMLFKTKLHAKQDETLTNDNQIESEKVLRK